MDFAAKKLWHQTNLDANYHAADLALLKSKQPDRLTKRIINSNHDKVLWHLIYHDIATPEEILANRAKWYEEHEVKEKPQAPAGRVVNETKKPAGYESLTDTVKKKAAQLFNKKTGNQKQGTGKPKNKNTHK